MSSRRLTQRDHALRRRLERQREDLRRAARERIHEARELNPFETGGGLDSADLCVNDVRENLDFALIELQTETLAKIDEALDRLNAGTYGVCIDCGRDIAAHMADVSSGGTQCASYAECAPMLANGQDIDYEGKSGPVEFADNGDPSQAVMGVYVYGADNKFTPADFIAGQVPDLPQGE